MLDGHSLSPNVLAECERAYCYDYSAFFSLLSLSLLSLDLCRDVGLIARVACKGLAPKARKRSTSLRLPASADSSSLLVNKSW